MVYFDTNVLIYAFSKNIDDERQKDISVKLVGDTINNNMKKLRRKDAISFRYRNDKYPKSRDCEIYSK